MNTLYNVTKTSEMTGMHPQTLRYYEKIKLLVPRRTLGGVRRYSGWDIEKLKKIRELSNQGVSLEGVAIILQLQEENNILRRQLQAHKQGAVFFSGDEGVEVGEFSAMSLMQQLKLFRAMRKKATRRQIEASRLQIEAAK